MAAIKSHAYQQELRRLTGRVIGDGSLLEAVEDLGGYAERRVRRLCGHFLVHGSSLVRRLVFRAFLEVWRRFPTYHGILPSIAAASRDEEIRDLVGDKLFVRVRMAGESMLDSIQF